MRHIAISCFCVLGLLAGAVYGQEGKPNLSGNWRVVAEKNGVKSQVSAARPALVSLVVEHKGSSIHMTKTFRTVDGKQLVSEFNCTTDGKDCVAKDCEGKEYKVSLWFDGKALVEMDASEDLVMKTVLTLDDERTICAGVVYIFPKETEEAIVFDRNP